jgi:hypothetical protein
VIRVPLWQGDESLTETELIEIRGKARELKSAIYVAAFSSDRFTPEFSRA